MTAQSKEALKFIKNSILASTIGHEETENNLDFMKYNLFNRLMIPL